MTIDITLCCLHCSDFLPETVKGAYSTRQLNAIRSMTTRHLRSEWATHREWHGRKLICDILLLITLS